ncbi:hypothetical protein ACWDZ6_05080 [Streptomyces sp. NPDC002926]
MPGLPAPAPGLPSGMMSSAPGMPPSCRAAALREETGHGPAAVADDRVRCTVRPGKWMPATLKVPTSGPALASGQVGRSGEAIALAAFTS